MRSGQGNDAAFGIQEAGRQLDGYPRFILTQLKRGLDRRQIVDEIAELHLGDLLEAHLRRTEEGRGSRRCMPTSMVLRYETCFRRSGHLS